MKKRSTPPLDPTHVFQSSRWIWPDSLSWDLHNCYALFRKDFELADLPATAPLFITADQSYHLWINGRYVCRGPARGFQRRWPFDEVDVRPFLLRGRNVLAVRAHHPGFSNFQYVSQGYAGLLVAARWGRTVIASDKTWRCRRQSGIRRDTVPTSLQLFCQEHIDLRAEDPGWMLPGFDDSAWTGTVADHPWNGMPWDRLEARGIPMLEERVVLPSLCLGEADGCCAPDYLDPRDAAAVRFAEGLDHRPVKRRASALGVPPTGPGRFRSYLLDFGRTEVGSVGFEINGARGGEIIDTLHGETIDPGRLALHYETGKSCRMAFSHRLVCRAGSQSHLFHHPFGFRYMVLTVRDSGSKMTIRPSLRTAMYPLEITGSFRSSDAGLEGIWKACAHTQRVCSLDAFVDTPWREQAQWWGDARVQAWNTFHLAGDPRLFRRGIAQIAAQTTPEGVTYGHAPTMAHGCILPDFSLIWILTLWDYYWQTGSTEPLRAHAGAVEGILGYFRSATNPRTGLVAYDPRYWLFLDWTAIHREGCPTVLNLWLLIALEKLARMKSLIRADAEAGALRRWAQQLRGALADLVDADGLMRDGLDARGRRVADASVHSQTLAIMAGIEQVSAREALDRILLPFIREEKSFVAQPSAYWVTYVFTVLQERGYGREVIDFIARHWKPMAAHGTTWENFSPRVGDESFSHAWSAHPIYHFAQIVGGIRQAAPAWQRIIFQPHFIGQHAESIVPTPKGPVSGAWEKSGGQTTVRLELPDGVVARVQLPGVRERVVRGNREWSIPDSSAAQ